MNKVVKTEFSHFSTEITYDNSEKYRTTYKILPQSYSDKSKDLEGYSLTINDSEMADANGICLTDVLNTVLFELRLRQVGGFPNRKYDNAINGVLIALKSLSND
jgi:hypothetical protein